MFVLTTLKFSITNKIQLPTFFHLIFLMHGSKNEQVYYKEIRQQLHRLKRHKLVATCAFLAVYGCPKLILFMLVIYYHFCKLFILLSSSNSSFLVLVKGQHCHSKHFLYRFSTSFEIKNRNIVKCHVVISL